MGLLPFSRGLHQSLLTRSSSKDPQMTAGSLNFTAPVLGLPLLSGDFSEALGLHRLLFCTAFSILASFLVLKAMERSNPE